MNVGNEFIVVNPTAKWLSIKFTVVDVGEETCFVEYLRDAKHKNTIQVSIDDVIKSWAEGKVIFTKPDVECLNMEEVFNQLYE